MTPWMTIAFASVVGALSFFFAGYTLRTRAGVATVGSSVGAVAATDLRSLLDALQCATDSCAVAVLDRDGLIVAQAGPTTDEALALAASVGAGLERPAMAQDAVVATSTDSGQPLRLRYAVVRSGPSAGLYVVATVGSRASAAPKIEDQVFAALPTAHLARAS